MVKMNYIIYILGNFTMRFVFYVGKGLGITTEWQAVKMSFMERSLIWDLYRN